MHAAHQKGVQEYFFIESNNQSIDGAELPSAESRKALTVRPLFRDDRGDAELNLAQCVDQKLELAVLLLECL